MAKRVLILVDEANMSAAAEEKGRRVDWPLLRDFLVRADGGRELLEMVVFMGLPPLNEEFAERRMHKDSLVARLRTQGFMVVTQEGAPREEGRYKANLDVHIAVDALDMSWDMRPDVVVLCTGDGDFAHLAMMLRRRGIRVEVASEPGSLGYALKEAANEVLDVSPLYEQFAEWEDAPRTGQKSAAAYGRGV